MQHPAAHLIVILCIQLIQKCMWEVDKNNFILFQPALLYKQLCWSVGRSVRWSVGPSHHYSASVFCITAPAQSHVTDALVYMAPPTLLPLPSRTRLMLSRWPCCVRSQNQGPLSQSLLSQSLSSQIPSSQCPSNLTNLQWNFDFQNALIASKFP